MTSEFSVRFGELTVRYVGELDGLELGSHQRRFLESEKAADLTVHISRPTQLTPPAGTLLWESNEERVYCDAGCTLHYYSFVPPAARDYLRLRSDESVPDRLSVELLRELPFQTEKVLLSNLEMERVLHRRGQTVLHASWVMHKEMALLFSGNSGVGKSTQAELWHRFRGTRIINGDKVGIAFPAGCVTAVGMPFAGSSTYYEDASAPVRAIVMLEHAPFDAIRLLSKQEAVRLLARQMPCQRWCASDVTAVLDYAARIAAQVPVYLLRCTKEESAVALLERTLAEGEVNGT